MKGIDGIVECLHSSRNIALFIHSRPDGDAIGSATALKMALEINGKTVDIYCDGDINSNYNFIKFSNSISRPQYLGAYDVAVALDCNGINRLGKFADLFNSTKKTINIDHHIGCSNFAQINCVQQTSSTGEIVYEVIKGLKVDITKDIANSLYSAIASDTFCFQHSNTTSNAHLICGKLLKTEFDFNKANYFLFKKRTLGQMQLLKMGLHNLRLFLDNRVAIMYLTQKDLVECDSQENYGLVDMCVNIENVEIGILISEIKPHLFACSLRGKGKINVANIAEIFGGGGHKDAAGCNVFGGLNTVLNKLIKGCKKYLC